MLKPTIDDWRAWWIAWQIDPEHDGKVFNIGSRRVRKRTDFVQGKYELPSAENQRHRGCEDHRLLGEEVLVTRTLNRAVARRSLMPLL